MVLDGPFKDYFLFSFVYLISSSNLFCFSENVWLFFKRISSKWIVKNRKAGNARKKIKQFERFTIDYLMNSCWIAFKQLIRLMNWYKWLHKKYKKPLWPLWVLLVFDNIGKNKTHPSQMHRSAIFQFSIQNVKSLLWLGVNRW